MSPAVDESQALLSAPIQGDGDVDHILTRATTSSSGLYSLKESLIVAKSSEASYSQQYANIYFMRLTLLRPVTEAAARAKWGKDVPMSRVLDVRKDEKTWIIGTIFADMQLKPNVLNDLKTEMSLSAPVPPVSYYTEGDDVYIEDESGRVKLKGSFPRSEMVTGLIMAAVGSANDAGEFIVTETCRPGAPPQPAPEEPVIAEEDSSKLAVISGLNFGSPEAEGLHTRLLEEYLRGDLGGEQEQHEGASHVRLIIAGNSVDMTHEQDDVEDKAFTTKAVDFDMKPTHRLDAFLANIAPSIPIDIIPGEGDPSGFALPQAPLHFLLLPHASLTSTLSRHTNPHWSELGGKTILTMAGRSIDDICRYTGIGEREDTEGRLALAESILEWRHLAPTAPDTLACFPFQDRDPFILNRLPHILIIGNQPEFGTKIYKGQGQDVCRIILVPSFAKTGTLVSVDLQTLNVRTTVFSSGM